MLIQKFQQRYLRQDLPVLKPGMLVKVTHSFQEGGKERSQAFEGTIIKTHNKKDISSTFTVRKVVERIGVEKIFPLHSPTLKKIEIIHSGAVRRAKLYYLRGRTGKSAKLQKEKSEVKS